MDDGRPGPGRHLPWLLPLVFMLGVLADRLGWLPGGAGQPPADAGAALRPFYEAWRLVDRHYVDRSAVEPQRLARGAIRGMLASLGDVGHTSYLTPEEVRELE